MSVKSPAFSFAQSLRAVRGGRQMSLVLATSILVTGLLAVPRPAAITELPLPRIDWNRVRARHLVVTRAFLESRDRPLSYQLRSVGELIRRFGVAEVVADQRETQALQRELSLAVQESLRAEGPTELRRLLRLQTHLFIQAVRSWDLKGPVPRPLIELGGTFAAHARQAGWLKNGVGAVEEPLGMMFYVRWIRLTGLRGVAELDRNADDWRVYYGFRLSNPGSKSDRERLEKQLSLVEALSRYDPEYPRHYARGVLYYGLGDFRRAYDSFNIHLRLVPHGRFSLRARNAAAAAAVRMLGG